MGVRTAQATHRLLSAANTANATSVTTSFTTVLGVGGFNAGTISYLKLYDKGSTPSETDTPRRTEYLPANTRFQIDFVNPVVFGKGLAYRITTGSADNDTGSVAAGAILGLNIDYA